MNFTTVFYLTQETQSNVTLTGNILKIINEIRSTPFFNPESPKSIVPSTGEAHLNLALPYFKCSRASCVYRLPQWTA